MARLTRGERKEQTRTDLVATAREVFLRRGFHPASLEEIAEEAGYSKGAVYSNFASKDELFLAVLDAQYERQLQVQVALMLQAESLEAGLRAAARQLSERSRQDPGWVPLLVEFWAHAARRPPLRQEVHKRHEQQLQGFAAMLTQLADRYGIGFTVPAVEVARSAAALRRGIALDVHLDPDSTTTELFEDAFAALVLGLTRPRGTS